MFAVWLLVITTLVAVVVLLTLGRGGGLPATRPDDVELDLPVDRPVGQADLAAVRFPTALRGYRMSVVDDLLDRVGAELAARDARIAELEAGARSRP
jgi:DivIVA domain-containing protein